MFGEFGEIELKPFDMIEFIMVTTIVPLVLLNLLVAIVSEAYTTVQEDIDKIDNAQLNSMILEIETYMVWNKHIDDLQYLVYAQYDD